LRRLCTRKRPLPTSPFRPTPAHRHGARTPPSGRHLTPFLPQPGLCLSRLGGLGQSPRQWPSQWCAKKRISRKYSMRYPVRSVQVARGTGTRTRSRMVSEALPTMWHGGALHPPVLLARVMPWLHKKLPTDAPKARTSSRREGDVGVGCLPRLGRIVSLGQTSGTPYTPHVPTTSQAKSRARRTGRPLRHHADAPYVNLGTLSSSPARGRSACDQCGQGAEPS